MDGWQTLVEFEAFARIFGSRACLPWVHALRNPLILGDWGSQSEQAACVRSVRKRWGARALRSEDFPRGDCDILIYCSSDKPSVQPAMNWLAQRLGRAGLRVCLWGPGGLAWYSCETSDEMAAVPTAALCGLFSWWDVAAAGWWACQTYVHARLSREALGRRLADRPARLLCEMAASRSDARLARTVLDRLSPAFIVTNGEQTRMGVMLTAQAQTQGVPVAWFFNEWPTWQMAPIISDEVWVWNDWVRDAIMALPWCNGREPRVEIIGMAQLDCMQDQAADHRGLDWGLPEKPTLVFVSEHIPAYAQHNSAGTRAAMGWIGRAAAALPDWSFLVKPRPYHARAPLPGEDGLARLPNVRILRDEMPMAQLLSAPQVRAMAALSSSALLLAAATGRLALRLAVDATTFPIPALDQAVVRADSAEALIAALVSAEPPSITAAFPYRGQVLERMHALCADRARSPVRAERA